MKVENKKNDIEKENCSNRKKEDNQRNCCCHPEIWAIPKTEFVSAIKLAEEKNYMTLVDKGNTLERRNVEAFKDAKNLQETIILLKEKCQKMQGFFCLGKNWITDCDNLDSCS